MPKRPHESYKIYNTPTKRRKVTGGPSKRIEEGEEQYDADQEWDVKDIVAERKEDYKISWEGVNPKTGKPWPNTWVGVLLLVYH